MHKDLVETTQAIGGIVWKHCDECENGNGTDCRLPWMNRGESSDCTRVLQHSWFFRVTIESRTKHEMVTAISVEAFQGVLQTEQKHIGKRREAIETEMNIRHSETYRRPTGARYLVGSTLAPMCKSRYLVHFVAVDVKSTRTIVDQAFSVPKCVRLSRMSDKSYELLCKMFSAVPERTKEDLESILGETFMGSPVGTSVTLKYKSRKDQPSRITKH